MISALEFLKAKTKICKSNGQCCWKCPLSSTNNGTGKSCTKFIDDYPEKAIEIVENWAKENPVKTYKDVLLEKFPKVELYNNGIPKPCKGTLFGHECERSVGSGCIECWNQEYTEQEDNNG